LGRENLLKLFAKEFYNSELTREIKEKYSFYRERDFQRLLICKYAKKGELTQTQIAIKLGITLRTVNYIINGY
jgi:hypothetical protein